MVRGRQIMNESRASILPEHEFDNVVPKRNVGSSAIATMLRRQILDGRFAFNERLPAERFLASQLGAARGTIREALRQLEEMSLVSRRVGSGTFVTYKEQPERNDVAEVTSPLELIDVRLAVEPNMARMAVLNANARNIQRLEAALKMAESSTNSVNTFSKSDEAFHLALAECTQNPLMQWLYKSINEVRSHNQWNARKDKILSPEKIRSYNRQHRNLFDAVNSRDAERAVNALTQHLQEARADLLGEADP